MVECSYFYSILRLRVEIAGLTAFSLKSHSIYVVTASSKALSSGETPRTMLTSRQKAQKYWRAVAYRVCVPAETAVRRKSAVMSRGIWLLDYCLILIGRKFGVLWLESPGRSVHGHRLTWNPKIKYRNARKKRDGGSLPAAPVQTETT